ncbi:MAG: flavin reductase [Oscillospiraceae bacterium]|nr:flavin reductase [Oscillospiraceae bacterium]
MNKNAIRNMSYGVYVISSKDAGRDVGCVANSAMQITSSPATIAVSINHDNYTNGAIRSSGVFAISVLPEDIDQSVIGTFGFKSSRDVDKFSLVASVEKSGLRIPSGALCYIVCKVIDTMETATHTVFLGEVADADMLNSGEPMTYAYYHKVKKGTSPKNAPTYVEEEAAPSGWKCSICGYIENKEELPEGYTCPICTVPASMFNKL